MDHTQLQPIITRANTEYLIDFLETQIRNYAAEVYRTNAAFLRAHGIDGATAGFLYHSQLTKKPNEQ